MYQASHGVGDTLFEDFGLRLDGDPRAVTFLIFTISTVSMPSGASHKLCVWIRSPIPLNSANPSTSYVLPFNDSYIHQRIRKCDSFKIEGRFEFESLGAKMIMGFSSRMPETIVKPKPPPLDLHSSEKDKFWLFSLGMYFLQILYDLHGILWACVVRTFVLMF